MGRNSLKKKLQWRQGREVATDPIIQNGDKNDIIIPVMGPTGAGKSTYINSLLGRQVAPVGHSLRSCTVALQPIIVNDEVVIRKFPHLTGRRLIIVDTPGFDDTVSDDYEILRRLGLWLATSYSKDMKLAGIIYLQDICQRRVTGATRRNMEVFQKLCGKDAFKSIVLGTTQWKNLPASEIGDRRQDELQSTFWKEMIKSGTMVLRVDDNDPWKLVDAIIRKRLDKDTLLIIQNELVELNKIIPQTEAGQLLKYSIEEVIKMNREGGAQREELLQLIQAAEKLNVPLSRRIRSFFGL